MKIEIRGSVKDDYATSARLTIKIDGRVAGRVDLGAATAREAMLFGLADAARVIAQHGMVPARRPRRP